MLGNFTIIDAQFDKWLLIFNLLMCACTAGVFSALVYLSKKLGEVIRGSVFCVMVSLIFASLFRNLFYEILPSVFSSIGATFYNFYLLLTKRLWYDLMAVVMFAAHVACPLIVKFAVGFFKSTAKFVNKIDTRTFSAALDNFSAGRIAKPTFHFIC